MTKDIAELTCMACGRDLGSLVRPQGKKMYYEAATERPGAAKLVKQGPKSLGCGRCGGRALVGPFNRTVLYADDDFLRKTS